MKIKPLKSTVLVEADKAPEKKGSFYVAEEWKTRPPLGTVKAVGPAVITVKEGDRVLFERYASVILEDEQRLCQESHILAIVEDENGKSSS